MHDNSYTQQTIATVTIPYRTVKFLLTVNIIVDLFSEIRET